LHTRGASIETHAVPAKVRLLAKAIRARALRVVKPFPCFQRAVPRPDTIFGTRIAVRLLPEILNAENGILLIQFCPAARRPRTIARRF
jgi:hypothetical protein